MIVIAGTYQYRLIRRWFAPETRFCLWMTNLPREQFDADKVMSLYRCRWQIELLFKELKSNNRMQAFATHQKSLTEGLIWASLLSLLVKRRLALTLAGGHELSFFKTAKNAVVWLAPILEAVIHQALHQIAERLAWATDYLLKNGRRSQQRKSIKIAC